MEQKTIAINDNINSFMTVMSDNKDCPKQIPFAILNEEWAEINHSQTLKKLNECGGMSPVEIVANIEHISFFDLEHDLYDEVYYIAKLKKYLQFYLDIENNLKRIWVV